MKIGKSVTDLKFVILYIDLRRVIESDGKRRGMRKKSKLYVEDKCFKRTKESAYDSM